jgi:hypothetical protein
VEWQSAALDDEKDLPGEIAVLRVDLAHAQVENARLLGIINVDQRWLEEQLAQARSEVELHFGVATHAQSRVADLEGENRRLRDEISNLDGAQGARCECGCGRMVPEGRVVFSSDA